MKILHLVQFLGVGGLEKVLLLLIQEQQKAGHDVELCVYDYEQSWVQSFRDQGINVTTEYAKADGYDLNLIKFLKTKVYNYDIIHTHDLNPMMYIGPLKLVQKVSLKKFPKIVHTTHGMEHIDTGIKEKVFEKFLALSADCIVGVSPSIKEYYVKNLKTNSKKVHNIDNGTPVPVTLPALASETAKEALCDRFDLERNKKIWVSVARVVPLKDQGLLIELARKRADILLLIIGPSGDDKYFNKLKMNLPKNVHMLGAQDKINEILNGCDIFLSASHHEGIPISVLEAGAQGLPSVLTDIAGHKTLQDGLDEKVALYFKVEDLSSLESCINELEKDKELIKKIRSNLFDLVLNNYSSHKMFLQYNNIYNGKKC